MRHEQQAARLSGMLFAEALVIQCGDHSFAGAGGGDYQVAVVTPNGALGIQSVQNFLLVGIGQNIQGIDPAVVGLAVFFRLSGRGSAVPAALHRNIQTRWSSSSFQRWLRSFRWSPAGPFGSP